MFPHVCTNVDPNFDNVDRDGKVLTSLVEVTGRVAFRSAQPSIQLIPTTWSGEVIPSSVEERKRVSSCWPDSFHDVRMEVAGSKRVCVEDVVKTMN